MRRLICLALILCTSLISYSQSANPNAPLENDKEVRFGKLENGMTYYIRHNKKPEQRADFYLLTNVGAIQETPAQDGLAHFLEHMCLNGTKNLPGKMMIEYFQGIGVEFGRNINASTGVEQTMYNLNDIPVTRQGIIDTALLIMHDYSYLVTNDPAEIEKERGVIIEEWRTRRTSSWRMREKSMKYLYGGSKYETATVIGTKNNLETFPPEELVKFYKTWYRPDLQALVVVGDIDVDAIEAQIKSLFSDIPKAENPEPKIMHQIPNNEEPIVGIITDPEATNTSISLMIKTDPVPKEMTNLGVVYIKNLFESVISSIINERLSDIAKEPNAPFMGASFGFGDITKTKSATMANVATKVDGGLEGFNALLKEIERVKRFGFTQSELDRVKTNILSSLEYQKTKAGDRRNSQFVSQYISHFFNGNPYMTPDYRYDITKEYLSFITIEQLNKAVKDIIDLNKNVVCLYNSIEKEGLTHPIEADIIKSIESMSSLELEAPKEENLNVQLLDPTTLKGSPVKKSKTSVFGSTEWRLKNGIKVVVLPTQHRKDEILINITNDGGTSTLDDKYLPVINRDVLSTYQGSSGLSEFTESQMEKILTGKMFSVSPSIGTLTQGASINSTNKDLEMALQVMYLYYTAPRFNEDEFMVGINRIKQILPNILNQPSFKYQMAISETLYKNHPRTQIISAEMIEKVNIKDLEEAYKILFSNAAGSVVTIVGDVNLNTLKPLVELYFGSLPVSKKAPKWIDRDIDITNGEIDNIFETQMTTPKTTIGLFISTDIKYTEENRILAGALRHILDIVYTKSIREDEGGTYGVSANCNINAIPKEKGIIQISFDTNKEQAEKLIQIAIDELKNIATNGATDEQLEMAKSNFLKNIPELRISNSYWLNAINYYYRYGVDTDTNYEELVNKSITQEKLKKFASTFVNSGNLIKVVMNPETESK